MCSVGGVTVTSTVRVEWGGTLTFRRENVTPVFKPATICGEVFGPHVPAGEKSALRVWVTSAPERLAIVSLVGLVESVSPREIFEGVTVDGEAFDPRLECDVAWAGMSMSPPPWRWTGSATRAWLGRPRRAGSARSTGLAVFCNSARTSAEFRDGLAWSSSAAAPATCGAAMDVPDSVAYPRFSRG